MAERTPNDGHYHDICFGTMESPERNCILEQGYAREDSKGNLTGELSTLVFETSIHNGNGEVADNTAHGVQRHEETLFHVNGEPVNILRRSRRLNSTDSRDSPKIPKDSPLQGISANVGKNKENRVESRPLSSLMTNSPRSPLLSSGSKMNSSAWCMRINSIKESESHILDIEKINNENPDPEENHENFVSPGILFDTPIQKKMRNVALPEKTISSLFATPHEIQETPIAEAKRGKKILKKELATPMQLNESANGNIGDTTLNHLFATPVTFMTTPTSHSEPQELTIRRSARIASAKKGFMGTPFQIYESKANLTSHGDTTLNLFATPSTPGLPETQSYDSEQHEIKRSERIMKMKETPPKPKGNEFGYWKTPKNYCSTPPPSELNMSQKSSSKKSVMVPESPLLIEMLGKLKLSTPCPKQKHNPKTLYLEIQSAPEDIQVQDQAISTSNVDKENDIENGTSQAIEDRAPMDEGLLSIRETPENDVSLVSTIREKTEFGSNSQVSTQNDESEDEKEDETKESNVNVENEGNELNVDNTTCENGVKDEEKQVVAQDNEVVEPEIEAQRVGVQVSANEDRTEMLHLSFEPPAPLESIATGNTMGMEQNLSSIAETSIDEVSDIPVSPIEKSMNENSLSDSDKENGISEITSQDLNTTFDTDSLSESLLNIQNITIPDANVQKDEETVNLMEFSTISLFTHRVSTANRRASEDLIDLGRKSMSRNEMIRLNSPQHSRELSYASPMKNRIMRWKTNSPAVPRTPNRMSMADRRSFNVPKNVGFTSVSNDYARSTSQLLNPSQNGENMDDSVSIMEKLLEEAYAAGSMEELQTGNATGSMESLEKNTNEVKEENTRKSPNASKVQSPLKIFKSQRFVHLMKESSTRPSPPRPKSFSTDPERALQNSSPTSHKRSILKGFSTNRPNAPVKNPEQAKTPGSTPTKITRPDYIVVNKYLPSASATKPASSPGNKPCWKTPSKICKIPTPMSSAKRFVATNTHRDVQSPVACYIYNKPVPAKLTCVHHSPCTTPKGPEPRFCSPSSRGTKIPTFKPITASATGGESRIPKIRSNLSAESSKLPRKELNPTKFKAADGNIGPVRNSIPIMQAHTGERSNVGEASIVEQRQMPRNFIPERHQPAGGSRLRLPTNYSHRFQ